MHPASAVQSTDDCTRRPVTRSRQGGRWHALLRSTVGKSYAQVVHERPDLGRLVGGETLHSGDQIMKHVGDFGAAQSSYGGIYGKQEHQARAVYFLVDGKGMVKDRIVKASSGHPW
jgi:hypothetical protein